MIGYPRCYTVVVEFSRALDIRRQLVNYLQLQVAHEGFNLGSRVIDEERAGSVIDSSLTAGRNQENDMSSPVCVSILTNRRHSISETRKVTHPWLDLDSTATDERFFAI